MSLTKQTAGRLLRPLVILLVITLAACSDKPSQDMSGMKVPVTAIKIEPQKTQVNIQLPGRVAAIEDAEIRARVTGIVQSIEFEQGSQVKTGDLLFIIDPAPYIAVRDQAKAQLQNAIAAEKTASLLAKRYSALIGKHAISQQDFDNAQAQARQAKAAVAAAKAALDSAEIDLGYTKVTSPIDGTIGKSLVTVGALVSASSATNLATVHRFDEVYVDITQPVGQLAILRKELRDGMLKKDDDGDTNANIMLDDGSLYEHSGKLLFSGIAVDPSTGQINLRAIFPNPDQYLLPGLYVRVQLPQGIDEKALIVPTQAVQRTVDGNNSLVVIKDGKAVFTPVKLGPQSGQGYIVTDGLEAGDMVVTAGFQKIRPGAPVQVLPPKAKQANVDGANKANAGESKQTKAAGYEQAKPDAAENSDQTSQDAGSDKAAEQK